MYSLIKGGRVTFTELTTFFDELKDTSSGKRLDLIEEYVQSHKPPSQILASENDPGVIQEHTFSPAEEIVQEPVLTRKYQIEDLRKFDPKKAALAVKVLAQSIPRHAQISALSDLIDEIITPIGGRLSEWNSPWEQVE